MKRVWLNIINGTFSNSWDKDSLLDIQYSSLEEEMKEAAKKGYKLIEYTCLNDPDFELYNQMKLH